MKKQLKLGRGIFILSLDFELAWGMHDLWHTDTGIPPDMMAGYMYTRNELVDVLLALFQKYEIAATWATVGYLFHERSATNEHIQRLSGATKADQAAYESVWTGRDLIQKIRDIQPTQDIGCHTYSHAIFSDPGCTPDIADAEVANCVALASEMGISLKSFVFPRNEEAYHDVLKRHGFTSYRAGQPGWASQMPGQRQRWVNFLCDVVGFTPPLATVEEKCDGLWGISASAYYRPAYDKARFIPMRSRLRQSLRGLDKAIKKSGVYHLYLHPSDMAFATVPLLNGLEQILSYAAKARAKGQLDTFSMAQMAELLQANKDELLTYSPSVDWVEA